MSRSSSTLSSATWIRSARSGSSLRQKTPRLVRGTMPKWMVSGSPRVRPSATLTGSMSPIRSPTLVSGVASFSPYRSLRCCQVTASSSPCSAGEAAAAGADRRVGVVVDLAAGDHRGPLVEQAADRADQPGLALAALAQQDDVVPGEQGALHVRQHGLVEADDAGEPILPGAHPRQQVLSDLLLDRAIDVAARLQLAQCGRPAVRSACVGMIAALLHPSDTMSRYRVFASWGGPGGR